VLVRKGFGRAEFEQAVDELRGTPARLLVYLLLKPMGLDERGAIEDAVASAKYVFAVAAARGVRARAALQPTFVAPGTALEQDFLAGRYVPPRLRSVVEVVRRTRALGEITVGMSDEGLDPRMVPAGCARCTPVLRRAIAEFNRTQDARVLDGPECDCE
jgi:radical SAM enzyme (TIGR01210 family)